MDRPLQIHLKPSRIAQYYCLALLLLSLLAIVLTSFVFWIKALLVVMVFTYVLTACRQLQQVPFAILEWQQDEWCLHGRAESVMVSLQQKVFAGAGIVVLPFRSDSGKTIRLLLWPDSTDAGSLQRLRVLLFSLSL